MNHNHKRLTILLTTLTLLLLTASTAYALVEWDSDYVYVLDGGEISLAEGTTATFDTDANTGASVQFVKDGDTHTISLDAVNITISNFYTDSQLAFTTDTALLGTITITTDWGPPTTVTNAADSYNALTKTLTLQVLDNQQVVLQWPNTPQSSALDDTYSIIYTSLPLLGLLALAVIGSVTFMFIMNRGGDVSYVGMAIIVMVTVIIGVAVASAIMSAIQTSGIIP
jgi:hypothetical protein